MTAAAPARWRGRLRARRRPRAARARHHRAVRRRRAAARPRCCAASPAWSGRADARCASATRSGRTTPRRLPAHLAPAAGLRVPGGQPVRPPGRARQPATTAASARGAASAASTGRRGRAAGHRRACWRRRTQLSGGERQRVAIARALATQPAPAAAGRAAGRARPRAPARDPALAGAAARRAAHADAVRHARGRRGGAAGRHAGAAGRRAVSAAGPLAAVLARSTCRWCSATKPARCWPAGGRARRALAPGARRFRRRPPVAARRRPAAGARRARARAGARRQPGHAEPARTSIQNLLPCTVRAIARGAHPSQALVQLACGQAAAGAHHGARGGRAAARAGHAGVGAGEIGRAGGVALVNATARP